MYRVIYNEEWEEWQVENSFSGQSEWSPKFMYGFDTKEEAVACSEQLKKWDKNCGHVSERKLRPDKGRVTEEETWKQTIEGKE
jgi:hypothetical protein